MHRALLMPMSQPSPQSRTILAILDRLYASGEPVILRIVLLAFSERALGALMVVFAVPLLLPMPPLVSAAFGVPLLLVTLQLMVRGKTLWLPSGLSRRSIGHAHMEAALHRVRPVLARLERHVHPRWTFMFGPFAEIVIGAVTLTLAFTLFLPLPFGSMAPAFVIATFGLSLFEQDGLLAAIGWIGAIASFGLVAALHAAG